MTAATLGMVCHLLARIY